MALKKTIIQRDGVPTEYHRILFIQSMINSHTSIAVVSYVSDSSRRTEGVTVRPYNVSVTYQTDYTENMTIQDAYGYLKTLPEFEGAEDI
jgi:hypothetical protein